MPTPWPVLVVLGLLTGVLQGFFGVGGGWLTTPALNILGFPMVHAIGTDLAFTAASASLAAGRHRQLGNLNLRLAGVLAVPGLFGVELSRRLVLALGEVGLAGTVVRGTYILLLLGVGLAIVLHEARGSPPGPRSGPPGTDTRRPLLALEAPHVMWVPEAAMAVPFWAVVATGLVAGLLAGFLGTGGGFLMVPALVYGLGLPSRVAVAASLLSIALTNSFGALGYGFAGRVELLAALALLLGALPGTQAGAMATMYVRGERLQLLLGVTLVTAGSAVALRQLGYSAASGLLMFVGVSAMSGVILAILARGRLRSKGGASGAADSTP